MLSYMPGENWVHTHESIVENINGNTPKDLYELKKSVQGNVQVPDALRVTPRIPKQKISEPKTVVVSGEFFGEKKGAAPGWKYSIKTCKEFNYLSLHRKLSYDEYNELFSDFMDVKQGDFGDCYLVSSIKSLARAKYFDTLMMTSIKKNNDGSFYIYLPLGSPSGNKIHISKEELNLAKINGSLGYKILEVGFAKKLLLRNVKDASDIKLTKELMNNIVGGNSYIALGVLLGYSNVKRSLVDNNSEKKEQILCELKKFNPMHGDMIIISSNRRPRGVPSTQKTYEVDGQSMYYHHAYSLYAVEKKGRYIESVIIENPIDNKKIKLSLSSFLSSFSRITTCCPLEGFLSTFKKIY